MTDRATLEALLARVLEGTGPDRELDAEIALAFGVVSSRTGNCFYGHKYYSVMVLDRDFYEHDGTAPELPPYTASLDAALTLLPEGWGWRRRSNLTMALVYGESEKYDLVSVHCDPPRALIAACIKARMEAQPSSDT